jgi:hypothetical protein
MAASGRLETLDGPKATGRETKGGKQDFILRLCLYCHRVSA